MAEEVDDGSVGKRSCGILDLIRSDSHALSGGFGSRIGLIDANPTESVDQFIETWKSVGWVFLDRLENKVVELTCDLFIVDRQGGGTFLEVLVQEFGLRVAPKRRATAS